MTSTAPVCALTNTSAMNVEEKKEEDDDSGSGIMDLANFLSSELTLTLQTVVPNVGREPEEERTYVMRRQSNISSAGSRRNSIITQPVSFGDSTSSIDTVKISNKHHILVEDLECSPDSDSKNGCFSMKSIDDLASILALPRREDLTPLHRRSQGNKAA